MSINTKPVLTTLVLAAMLCAPIMAQAHVSVWPRESTLGATEKYTVRVPTEDAVATVGAELEVPAGAIVETLAVPNGWMQDVKRADDRIVSISWKMNIPSGQFAEFAFVARNPREGTEMVWKLRQLFADGSVKDWTNGPRGTYPTAVTKPNPRKAP